MTFVCSAKANSEPIHRKSLVESTHFNLKTSSIVIGLVFNLIFTTTKRKKHLTKQGYNDIIIKRV